MTHERDIRSGHIAERELTDLDQPMTDGRVSWYLELTRLSAIRRRVEREGFTADVAIAFADTQTELTRSLLQIDRERTSVVASIRFDTTGEST